MAPNSFRIPRTELRIRVLFIVALMALFSVLENFADRSSASWSSTTVITLEANAQASGNLATLDSVSCASPGNCVAVGYFESPVGAMRAFIVESVNGTWSVGQPIIHPSGAPNESKLEEVSCASENYCVAVGNYFNSNGSKIPFHVSRTNGIWSTATSPVFSLDVATPLRNAFYTSVSCVQNFSCLAGGTVEAADGYFKGFVITGSSNNWSTAQFVPALVNSELDAFLEDISCYGSFECDVVGWAPSVNYEYEGVLAKLINGSEVTSSQIGFASGSHGPYRDVLATTIECSSDQLCATGGHFYSNREAYEAFTAVKVGNSWSVAEVSRPASGTDSQTPDSKIIDISCGSSSSCVAIGQFRSASGSYEGFTTWYMNGSWQTATPVEFVNGLVASQKNAILTEVSCFADGGCIAVGSVAVSSGGRAAFAMRSVNGQWELADRIQIDFGVEGSTPSAESKGVACLLDGNCVVVGQLTNTSSDIVPFGYSYTVPVVTTTTTIVPTTPTPTNTSTTSTTLDTPSSSSSTTSPSTSTTTTTIGTNLTTTTVGVHGPTTTLPYFPSTTVISITPGTSDFPASPTTTSPTATSTMPPSNAAASTRNAPTLNEIIALPKAINPIDPDGIVEKGRRTVINVGGFEPFEFIQIYVASTPTMIAETFADAFGNATLEIEFPISLSSGQHTLIAYGPTTGIGFTQPITVESLSLPATGRSAMMIFSFGLAIASFGYMLRRRSSLN